MSYLTFSPNDSRGSNSVSESYHPWFPEHGEVLLGDRRRSSKCNLKEGACKYDQVVEGNVDTVVGINHPVEEIRIQVMYLATDLISTGM